MTTEGTPAPAGNEQVESGAEAPDMSLWSDATRDAIIEKYGNDQASLAKGYWNSQQTHDKRNADAASISNERADFVQQRQEWEAERLTHASALETANESAVTAADVNKNVFGAIQDDLVLEGKVSDETKAALVELGFDNEFQTRYVEAIETTLNARFEAAQEHAPGGTDVKELLKFVNEDAVKTEGGVFSAEELAYFNDRANKRDYGFVAQVEAKYLESLGKGEKAKKAAKVPTHSNRGPTNNPDSFKTQAEYDKAKATKEYHTDYDVRQEVDRKYKNSDVKAFADAKMEEMFGPNWDAGNSAIRGG